MSGFICYIAVRLKDLGERRKWGWLMRLGCRLWDGVFYGKAK